MKAQFHLSLAAALVSAAGSASAQNCVWQLNPAAGSYLTAGTSCYDSIRQRVVLCYDTSQLQTWEFDGASWILRNSTVFGGRHGSSTAFDSARGRIVLFGGVNTSLPTPYFTDTFEWDGTQWFQFATTGPIGRINFGMAYDDARAKTVIYGGQIGVFPLDDTWEWDGATWVQRTGPNPGLRADHAMAYDSIRARTVMHGGVLSSGPVNDTWEWDGSTWQQRQVAGPPARRSARMAFDNARGRMILVGGVFGQQDTTRELWEFDGAAGTWTLRVPVGPISGFELPAAFDSQRLRLVTPRTTEGTWEYNGAITGLAPWVTMNPMPYSIVVLPPTTVVLTAAFGGSEPLSYQWFKDFNTPLVNGGNISGATTTTLTINPTSPSDSGFYGVTATNPCGTAESAGAHVWVGVPDCYVNCDASTIVPYLNINDYVCFVNAFAAGNTYANCDFSTHAPVLNVNDYSCFVNRYAAGCP